MTLTDASAYFGLLAGATPSSTNVANNVLIGQALTKMSFSAADVAYSFKVAGDDTEQARLTLSTGAVTDVAGATTKTDNDEDFEGGALPAVTIIYAVLVECTAAAATSITVDGTFGMAAKLYVVGDRAQVGYASGDTNMGQVDILFSGAGGEVEVTVFADVA